MSISGRIHLFSPWKKNTLSMWCSWTSALVGRLLVPGALSRLYFSVAWVFNWSAEILTASCEHQSVNSTTEKWIHELLNTSYLPDTAPESLYLQPHHQVKISPLFPVLTVSIVYMVMNIWKKHGIMKDKLKEVFLSMSHLVFSRIWLQELTVVRGICSL